jgi:hypothetical protein
MALLNRPLGTEGVHIANRLSQHLSVEEENSVQGLVLTAVVAGLLRAPGRLPVKGSSFRISVARVVGQERSKGLEEHPADLPL